MQQENRTMVTKFVLLGLSCSPELQPVFFLLFFLLYLITILGNFLIMATTASEPQLQTPMYLFLRNLSFLDFCYISVTAPKMLAGFLLPPQTISYGGCVAQIFFFHFSGGTEIFLLTVMAYDRYVAIFHPLRYVTIMNRGMCVGLVMASWVGGFIHSIVQVAIILQLPFCGPNKLDNFYCDVPQVVKLACTNTFTAELLMVSNNGLVTLLCFVVLLISYSVLLAKLRTRSSEGRSKALSTCASHITVVTLIFGPCVYIYARPFCTFPMDKAVSVIYTIITPMLNPVIYTLRNKDMKLAMGKLWTHIWHC
ncbi:PREDICTED: olfactory receptor 4D5-like [Gavialis gangeticus]|uniref:olfactory receptor 4D5-like n=1 Tax=Gavialis gangeticus TaxID=94835 RepID=UPI00092EAADC|nr:PREDICTED: olfactory receptor 4D5-like [Gavialis gangeticus]